MCSGRSPAWTTATPAGRPAIARFMGAALVVIGLAALVVVLIGA
jgi:hypothetical protein